MARNAAGIERGARKIPELREEFWRNVRSPARRGFQSVAGARRDARDFLEFAELMCH